MARATDRKEDPLSNLDLRAAIPQAQAPEIAFAFEFPELLELFESFDGPANRKRKANRRLGYLSIALVTLALLIASADAVLGYFGESVHELLRLGAGLLGLVGTAIALLGLRRTAARRRWIALRFRTESLRLFHFHYIAARLPEIVAASGDPAREADYVARRKEALQLFVKALIGRTDDELAPRLKAPETLALADYVAPLPVPETAGGPVAERIFEAWRLLRPDWQINYCDAKLNADLTKFETPRQQERRLSLIAWTCIVLILLLHGLHLLEPWLHLAPADAAYAQMVVVWTAIVALAVRALEAGLAPQREVERYEQYRVRSKTMLSRFNGAKGLRAKVESMLAFEQTSQDEMHLFVRTQTQSRFLL